VVQGCTGYGPKDGIQRVLDDESDYKSGRIYIKAKEVSNEK
jgi:hypothetical protein